MKEQVQKIPDLPSGDELSESMEVLNNFLEVQGIEFEQRSALMLLWDGKEDTEDEISQSLNEAVKRMSEEEGKKVIKARNDFWKTIDKGSATNMGISFQEYWHLRNFFQIDENENPLTVSTTITGYAHALENKNMLQGVLAVDGKAAAVIMKIQSTFAASKQNG